MNVVLFSVLFCNVHHHIVSIFTSYGKGEMKLWSVLNFKKYVSWGCIIIGKEAWLLNPQKLINSSWFLKHQWKMSVLYLMSKILSLIKDLSCVCFFVLFFLSELWDFRWRHRCGYIIILSIISIKFLFSY